MRTFFKRLCAATAIAFVGACAAPGPAQHSVARPDGLEINVEIRPTAVALPPALQSVRLWVSPTKDVRNTPDSKRVGQIKATVSDMYSTELHLERSVDELTTSALTSQLLRDGYRVVQQGQDYDYELGTQVKEFGFNVAGRDERRLLMALSLRKNGSEKLAWQAQVTEVSDRFAGVTGNSRATLSAYLEEGISQWVHEASTQLRAGMAPFTTPAAPVIATVATENQGWISVITTPTRAKVYVDNVYFGQTPLRARMPAGVVSMEIRRDGYKSVVEQVSIRIGETTELESTLSEI